MKKVILTGATGMIGGLVLQYCLQASDIDQVVVIGRRPTGLEHTKLKEYLRSDFMNYEDIEDAFRDISTAFFCLGAYTGSVSRETLKQITYDYTVAFAETLKKQSPEARFCFLSGSGADRTEKTRTAFALFKGMAENALVAQEYKELFIFRPAYIYPVEARKEPNVMYALSRMMYPLIRLMGRKVSIRSTELARAMYMSHYTPPTMSTLENSDILDYLDRLKH